MNKRFKEIDKFVNSINTQKEFDEKFKKKHLKYKKKFNELDEYNSVYNLEDLNNLKMGGYIRYVNLKGELRYGGILIKVFKSENDNEFNIKNLMILQNSQNIKFTISWEKNYIYYKTQTKKGDNLRDLFISLLNNK